MKGKNTIKLSEDTVLEALQEYFDKRYTPKQKVVAYATEWDNAVSKTLVTVILEEALPQVRFITEEEMKKRDCPFPSESTLYDSAPEVVSCNK